MKTLTLGEFLKKTEKAFNKAKLYFGHGTDNAWDEAVALAMAILDLPPNVKDDVVSRVLTEAEINQLEALVKRRIEERMPMPYLTNQAWFAGLKFYVDERVIIPRSPLGELIQKKFSPWWPENKPVRRILDLCCGSACIAIACAHAFPNARVDAIDISDEALSVAKKNINDLGYEGRVHLIKSDLFEKLKGLPSSQASKHSAEGLPNESFASKACLEPYYDIIISNPPYVSLSEMKTLPPEYQWEPSLALTAEQDGLSVVHRILRESKQYLDKKGLLIVEVGNSEWALKEAYPDIPFIWLEFERGGQGVFLLRAGEMNIG